MNEIKERKLIMDKYRIKETTYNNEKIYLIEKYDIFLNSWHVVVAGDTIKKVKINFKEEIDKRNNPPKETIIEDFEM